MESKLRGIVVLTFINGGIAKSGRPYLRCSNGRAEIFVSIPKTMAIDDDTFSEFTEDMPIALEVECTVGSDSVKLLRIPPQEK